MSSGLSSVRYPLVIFDMDGTLTEELLDFDAIRRDIGMPAQGGILEHIRQMPPADQQRANDILHSHEIEAADRCRLQPGATELLAVFRSRGIQTALLTRNSAPCAARILDRHQLRLDFVATRDHLPHKPHPDSILNITRRFGIPPSQTLMVGDYLYDLQAAAAAAVDSALLFTEGGRGAREAGPGQWPPFAAMATYRIRTLSELLPIVEKGKP
jgi:HAD superfamily hydrolase (TIGR01509 family)